MIRLPPSVPVINRREPSGRVTIAGVIEDSGLFPGRMKFATDGIYPNSFDVLGIEKSGLRG